MGAGACISLCIVGVLALGLSNLHWISALLVSILVFVLYG